MIYTKVGEITEGAREALLGLTTTLVGWERFDDDKRRYRCLTASPRVMFVIIPPGGYVDRHRDVSAKGNRLNIVLQTNPGCINYTAANGLEYSEHLLERGIYQFDATLEHWAVNHGKTDRIIMVETL